ncbi:hypothetical protein B0H13DRAFT_2535589 [Mycena leptocephala]|nr:hypothetical protein B0H13DRAFT_2535589 [Mycena leptocephala]
MTADEQTGVAHMGRSPSRLQKRPIPCQSQGLLTCSPAHWLNRRSPSAIHNPSAKSIEEETGIKQKRPRRAPVQVRLQEAESSEGGMGYMLAQRDASKSDGEGLEEPEETRERRERRERKRERSEIDMQQHGYRRAVRGGSRMSARAPGELHVLHVREQGEGTQACTTSAKIVQEG